MRVISGKARGTKLKSIEENSTRPTLDRVKESLFNIIHSRIQNSIILDLFAGSGAIGIEFISRGCEKAYFCDKSEKSIKCIKDNLEKTKLSDSAIIINKDYKSCLEQFKDKKIVFDIIFLDPPYKENFAIDSVNTILKLKLLNENGIIIIETDEKERELEGLKNLDIEIYDFRKYGRAYLLFLK